MRAAADSSAIYKTLAALQSDGTLRTNTYTYYFYGSSTSTGQRVGLHSVVTVNGNGFWASGGPGWDGVGYGGYMYAAAGNTAGMTLIQGSAPGYNARPLHRHFQQPGEFEC